nr:hypothetical protein CFP56_09491 [Quercus suber]
MTLLASDRMTTRFIPRTLNHDQSYLPAGTSCVTLVTRSTVAGAHEFRVILSHKMACGKDSPGGVIHTAQSHSGRFVGQSTMGKIHGSSSEASAILCRDDFASPAIDPDTRRGGPNQRLPGGSTTLRPLRFEPSGQLRIHDGRGSNKYYNATDQPFHLLLSPEWSPCGTLLRYALCYSIMSLTASSPRVSVQTPMFARDFSHINDCSFARPFCGSDSFSTPASSSHASSIYGDGCHTSPTTLEAPVWRHNLVNLLLLLLIPAGSDEIDLLLFDIIAIHLFADVRRRPVDFKKGVPPSMTTGLSSGSGQLELTPPYIISIYLPTDVDFARSLSTSALSMSW